MILLTLMLLALILVAAGAGMILFNQLRNADISAQEALGGIDVQLTRRADLVPNLVATVKGYASHEQAVLENVTAARAQAAQGGTVAAKAAADAALGTALVNVLAVAENYPDLKASANFLDLQAQLTDTENQLSFARQYYNDAVATLNKLVATLPWMLMAGIAGVARREFYQAPVAHQAPPTVSF